MRFGNVIEGVQAQSAGQAVMTGDDGKVPAELTRGGGGVSFKLYNDVPLSSFYDDLENAPVGTHVSLRYMTKNLTFEGYKITDKVIGGIGSADAGGQVTLNRVALSNGMLSATDGVDGYEVPIPSNSDMYALLMVPESVAGGGEPDLLICRLAEAVA